MPVWIHFYPQAGERTGGRSIAQTAICQVATTMTRAGKTLAGHINRAAQMRAYQAKGIKALFVMDDQQVCSRHNAAGAPWVIACRTQIHLRGRAALALITHEARQCSNTE